METKLKSETWVDITADFKSSVKHLQSGELVKCEALTLFEAMSAIELMDPKMDSGIRLNQIKRKICTFEEAIKLNMVKINDINNDELIGIIDESFCCYVTWLDGNSLAQSVMTNMYLHDPDKIEDKSLKVFSQAMIRLVDFSDYMIGMIGCIEEEDFVLNYARFVLAKVPNDQKIINSLEEVCVHYERLLSGQPKQASNIGLAKLSASTTSNDNKNKSMKQTSKITESQQSGLVEPQIDRKEKTQEETLGNSKVSSKKGSQKSQEQLTNNEREQIRAIIYRMRFMHNFFSVFYNMNKYIVTTDYDLNLDMGATYNKVLKTKNIQQAISTCDELLVKCLEYLEKWSTTIELGIKPKKEASDEKVDSTTSSYYIDYPTIMGFDPLINKKQIPPAYPRTPTITSRPDSLEYIKNLITKMRHCFSLSINLFNQRAALNKSMDAIENFGKYFKPSSCVMTRSLLQLLYLPNRSIFLFQNELHDTLGEFCEPLLESLNMEMFNNRTIHEFLLECSKSFSQLIIIYGHNRARQYEKIPDVIQGLKNLQYSSIILNDSMHNAFYYSWISYQLSKVSIRYILSGFELELYSSYEFPYIFWYLFEILLRSEHDQLDQTKKYIIETQKTIDEQQKQQKISAKSSSKNTNCVNSNGLGNSKQRRKRYNTFFHDKELLKNEALSALVKGLFFLTVGLKKDGKIPSPKLEYTTEEILFERRFDMLNNNLSQQFYARYKQTMVELDHIDAIYKIAFEWLSQSKNLLESMDDQESLLKVTKNNMVVAKILAANHRDEAFKNRSVDFQLDFHPSFPIFKINYQ